jgi:hypothetical protein
MRPHFGSGERLLANESELEVVVQHAVDGGHQVESHVVRRGAWVGGNQPQESFFQGLHSQTGVGHFVLYSTVPGVKSLSSVLVHSQWNINPEPRRGWRESLSEFTNDLVTPTNFRSLFEWNGRASPVHLQKLCPLIVCEMGCDASNVVSFCYTREILKIMLDAVLAVPASPEVFEKLIPPFVHSGDLISRMYCDTNALGGRGLRECAHGAVEPMSEQAAADIIRRRRQIGPGPPPLSPSTQAFLAPAWSDWGRAAVACVSAYPSACVLPPAQSVSPIFDFRDANAALPASASRFVLALARPATIVEIRIRTFEIDRAWNAPVALTIDGGVYRNRMLPLFRDLALVLTKKGTSIRFLFPRDSVYPTDIAFRDFPPVRFLSFAFRGARAAPDIGNIAVYGVVDLCPPSVIAAPTASGPPNICAIRIGTAVAHNNLHVDCCFVDSPPPSSEREMPAELILNPENLTEWRPHETVVPLAVLFRHQAQIRGVTVVCTAPVRLTIAGAGELEFVPPLTQCALAQPLDVRDRLLNCVVEGERIAIVRLAFMGDPIAPEFLDAPVLRRTWPQEAPLRRVSTALEFQGEYVTVRIPPDYAVVGFAFRPLPACSEIDVEYRRDGEEWETEHFQLPGEAASAYLMLANRAEMRECRIRLGGQRAELTRDFAVKLLTPYAPIPRAPS